MKYLKKYEELNQGEPEIGDYVILKPNTLIELTDNFIRNNIGQIKSNRERSYANYVIKYINVPEDIIGGFLFYEIENNKKGDVVYLSDRSDIQYYSKNKKELELILAANKYNL